MQGKFLAPVSPTGCCGSFSPLLLTSGGKYAIIVVVKGSSLRAPHAVCAVSTVKNSAQPILIPRVSGKICLNKTFIIRYSF